MSLAWNQLCDDFLKGPLQLESGDPEAQRLLAGFNSQTFDASLTLDLIQNGTDFQALWHVRSQRLEDGGCRL